MRIKTKILIEWAKIHFNTYSIEIHTKPKKYGLDPEGVKKEGALVADFINFLNSLPEVETHLCHGGYVQDRNGVPCCDGDAIIDNGITGTLRWSKDEYKFVLEKNDTFYSLTKNFVLCNVYELKRR